MSCHGAGASHEQRQPIEYKVSATQVSYLLARCNPSNYLTCRYALCFHGTIVEVVTGVCSATAHGVVIAALEVVFLVPLANHKLEEKEVDSLYRYRFASFLGSTLHSHLSRHFGGRSKIRLHLLTSPSLLARTALSNAS